MGVGSCGPCKRKENNQRFLGTRQYCRVLHPLLSQFHNASSILPVSTDADSTHSPCPDASAALRRSSSLCKIVRICGVTLSRTWSTILYAASESASWCRRGEELV